MGNPNKDDCFDFVDTVVKAKALKQGLLAIIFLTGCLAQLCAIAQITAPTLLSTVPEHGKYDFFKRNAEGENLRLINAYEEKVGGKAIAACFPDENHFYIVVKWPMKIRHPSDAIDFAYETCKATSTVLIGYGVSAQIDNTPTLEVVTNNDKVTGESSQIHRLHFSKIDNSGNEILCDECFATIWPDAIVVDGYSLIAGGTVDDIPVRIRLGKTIMSGICRLTNARRSCQLNVKGLTEKILAEKIRGHLGEVVIEFTQNPLLRGYNIDDKSTTIWTAVIGQSRTIPAPKPVKY